MIIYKDINGTLLKEGDTVYYARKSSYSASGRLLITRILSISGKGISLEGGYRSTLPDQQLAKIK